MKAFRTLGIVLMMSVCVIGLANAQTWSALNNPAPVSMGSMLLLTDGRVLVHEEPNCNPSSTCVGNSYATWYTLTPDSTGSYINGTWTQVASLPSGYEPLFFASAVLPDGNVVVQGGEYNCPSGSCGDAWQSKGALYNPATNTWSATTPPISNSWDAFGDAESVVLPNGTWMVVACCAQITGHSSYPEYFYFNESSLSFTNEASSSDGVFDDFDEEGFTLLPNGNVLTVDAYVGSYSATGMNSQLYNSTTNTWTNAGSTLVQLWDSHCGKEGLASYEVGPGVLMPNGTVFYTGGNSCAAGNTATYDWSSGVWTALSPFPNNDAANDAPASIETNGNVIVMASNYNGTFAAPSNFYEWNGSTLSSYANPPNATKDASYVGHLLVLPTGQIMFTDFSTDVEILTTAGTYESSWQPTITSYTKTLVPGTTYSITGTQFNGLTQGAAYGDDFQDATNYPLVQLVNTATGDVYYAKTHGHSTMAVATGSTSVSTNFDVPANMPTGACELYVIANGIPSEPASCTVGATKTTTTTTVTSSPNPSQVGETVTFTATVKSSDGTPTGKVTFRSGTTTLGTAALKSGVATFETSTLAKGNQKIVAAYSGSSTFASSSGSVVQKVE
ncbi:MAG TPA: Ig-like domain-containing protein [Candidatus Sulfotelmatobacter sp.]|nr:Ig-like domain-containing protein [Candidatus Sulfotelmatobacter sp.]